MTKKAKSLCSWVTAVIQQYKLYVVLPLFVFILLLAKNPFSERTLIPNFEPFPDSFHYLLPAKCIISSGGWNLCRPHTVGRSPDVAPLYSVTFIPFFLIKNDPRMFYFTNLSLAIASFILLQQIFSKLKIHPLVQLPVLSIAATSYHLYWFPTLAMAENLILFLFLLNLWLYLKKTLLANICGVLLALSFYGTKYAFAPLSVIFIIFYLFSLWQYSKTSQNKLFLPVAAAATIGLLLMIKSESVLSLFSSTFFKFSLTNLEAQSTWFSLSFLLRHIPQYTKSIFGQPTLILWDVRALFPWYLSILSVAGLLWGLTTSRYKSISLLLLASLLGQVLFISTFYAFDGRYILHAIYILILGQVLFYELLLKTIKRKQYVWAFIFGVTVIYILTQTQNVRYQIVLNLKYAETPWYYVATRHIDSVLADKGEQVVLITAVPVHFFDFFGANNYTILPISQEQERDRKDLIYGSQYNYNDLPLLYENLLKAGHQVYLNNYGLGHAGYMHEEYKLITDRFTTTLVAEGCYGSCNLYQLELKNSK